MDNDRVGKVENKAKESMESEEWSKEILNKRKRP